MPKSGLIERINLCCCTVSRYGALFILLLPDITRAVFGERPIKTAKNTLRHPDFLAMSQSRVSVANANFQEATMSSLSQAASSVEKRTNARTG